VFRRRRSGDAGPAARDGSEGAFPDVDEAAQDDLDEYDDEEDRYEEDQYDDYEEDDDQVPAAEFADDRHDGFSAEPDAGDSGETGRSARPRRDDLGDPETWTRLRDTAPTEPVHMRRAGPWDSGDNYPDSERLDLGCVQVPVNDSTNVQIAYSDETGVTLAVVSADSALQLQAFAAPRSSGLWDKVRPEIAAEVAKADGQNQEQEGPFGPELLAWVSPQVEGEGKLPPQPLRFLGADGPRWFLRGLISGPAATDPALAKPLEEVFGDVVVVRGDHAAPPETPLEIQLPEEARQAFEEQAQAEETGMPNPFERGPEITETR